MIGPDQVVNGVTIGLIFLALGVVPGLLQTLSDGLTQCACLLSWRRFSFLRRARNETPGPRSFAVTGVALIVLTFAAYFAG